MKKYPDEKMFLKFLLKKFLQESKTWYKKPTKHLSPQQKNYPFFGNGREISSFAM